MAEPWHNEVSVKGIEIDACPHCGGTYGWYIIIVERWAQEYDWNGVAIAASDAMPYGEPRKRVRCIECDGIVTKFIPEIG